MWLSLSTVVMAQLTRYWRVAVVGERYKSVAITDAALLSRILAMEKLGYRFVEQDYDGPALCVEDKNGVVVVCVDLDESLSETELLHDLLMAYDLDNALPEGAMLQ